MRSVEPEVFLVARPKVDYDAMAAYLREVGGERWLERIDRGQFDAQDLAEFAGKTCYRSWEPGLNPNVRKVRDDQDAYLQNILRQQHGSVLEHASFTFVLHNVSRVFTHEIARHRPGTAISQESLRYVRLDTGLVWTANVRTLRHTIEARTYQGAEEEIRLVFGKFGELMRAEAPALFG